MQIISLSFPLDVAFSMLSLYYLHGLDLLQGEFGVMYYKKNPLSTTAGMPLYYLQRKLFHAVAGTSPK